jgi:hypothetical protein
VVRVIIREVHKMDIPWDPHYVASVQLIDDEDNWVSKVFTIDFHNTKELERKVVQEIIMYEMAKLNYGKTVARGGS